MNNIKFTFTMADLSESFLIGVQMAYGEDSEGFFHMLDFGFLFFSITIYKYEEGI